MGRYLKRNLEEKRDHHVVIWGEHAGQQERSMLGALRKCDGAE